MMNNMRTTYTSSMGRLFDRKSIRFNEEIETESTASRKENDLKARTILNVRNIAAFVKDRPSLHLVGSVGVPNLNATKTENSSKKETASVFTRMRSKRY